MRSMELHSSSKEEMLPAPPKQQQLSADPISAGQRRLWTGPSLVRSGGTTAPALERKKRGRKREKNKNKNSRTKRERRSA